MNKLLVPKMTTMEANTLTENSRTKNLARAIISRKVPKLIERAIRDEIANLGFSVVVNSAHDSSAVLG